MSIGSYIGAPEDEPGYWDDKDPDEEDEGEHGENCVCDDCVWPPLSDEIRAAFVMRGWIIPTTEAEVAAIEEADIEW